MKTNSLQSDEKREQEQNACVMVLMAAGVLAAACIAGWLFSVLALAWPWVACAAKIAGVLVVAAGLWICAWECGRRFEAEHGKRKCGCVSKKEEAREGAPRQARDRTKTAKDLCGVGRRYVCKSERGAAADASAPDDWGTVGT